MMIRNIFIAAIVFACTGIAQAQGIASVGGKCSSEISWTFDGQTLTIEKTTPQRFGLTMPDYDVKTNPAPWAKRNLPVKRVKINVGISRIGACAFANMTQLETVEFQSDWSVEEIGWGAFLNCRSLFNFSIPLNMKKIGKIAFANCSSLRSVKIPKQTTVEDCAFLSCTNLSVVEIANNAVLGKGVFATEVRDGDQVRLQAYQGEIRGLPLNVSTANCEEYGLSRESVEHYQAKLSPSSASDEDYMTSEVDSIIPDGLYTRNDTYALIIGNENYRFVSNVPYARHDARIFSEYCKRTLGVPTNNIHVCLDATKHMILEQEIEDWLVNSIPDKEQKSVIIYYAGHGVPDMSDQNKSYILPTDVYGTKPKQGIALDEFYATIGNLGFKQVTLFIDACFSGVNRDNGSVNEGLRGTEVEAADSGPSTGNMVVFSAAQGNETAQGYQKHGHGLFTYYLLKEIQGSEGVISYGELARRLQYDVSTKAPTLELRKAQTPTVKASGSMTDAWRKTTL